MMKMDKVMYKKFYGYAATWLYRGNDQKNKNFWNSFEIAQNLNQAIGLGIEGRRSQ